MNTKTMIRGALALAGVALLSGAALAQQATLTINSFGGAYEAAHRKYVIEPFEKMYNVKVNVVTAYSADAFAQLRAQKNAPQFDVIHFSGGQEIVAAQEGLLDPLTEADLPNAASVYPFAKANMAKGEGPAYQIAVMGLLYNTKNAPKAPVKWTDITDPAFTEHLVLTDISNGYGMLSFLMLNKALGGDLDNIQPGLDATKKLLAAGATIVTKSPEIQQEFAQNDAWLAPYANDYAYTLTSAGLPVKFVQGEEGTPAVYITANLVHGRPNQDLAKKFIDLELSVSAQAGFAEAMHYSPTNSKVELPPMVAEGLVVGEKAVAGLLRFDPVKIEASRAAWVDAWKKAIAQ